jgi:hypothetical protein
MVTESVSFRISRHTEDLAQTTHALSQRLVKLEQRLEALELLTIRIQNTASERNPLEVDSLDNVERLLHDCRCLLGLDDSNPADQPGPEIASFNADVASEAA